MGRLIYRPWLEFALGLLFVGVMLLPVAERAVWDRNLRAGARAVSAAAAFGWPPASLAHMHVTMVPPDQAGRSSPALPVRIPESDGDPLPDADPLRPKVVPVASGAVIPGGEGSPQWRLRLDRDPDAV
jgi:hypothetical protein